MSDLLKKIVVTGMGTGYLRPAPGTWGSLAVVVIYMAVAACSQGSHAAIWGTMGGIVVLASIGCVATGRFCEKHFGRKDPSYCTIDEWAGQAMTFFLLPINYGANGWQLVAAAGFLAFRIFDITKPCPARRAEKLPYGWGVLLDDLAAGVYANIACQVFVRWAMPALGLPM